jgi:two-component system chemotaxis response regulator CheY
MARQAAGTAGGLSAVVIEDDMISRTLLRALLRSCGVEVVGETSLGRRGVELVETLLPDLVWLDIGLPDVDGAQVLAEIRARAPTVHVVMVTAVSESERVRAMLAAGAVGYIVKPYAQVRVLSTLQRLFPSLRFEAAT